LARAKTSLETQFVGVWVQGEVANFRPAPSGHWYFTLKDATAELKMAMFRGRNAYASVYPSNGMLIRARGRVTVFEARGELQMVAETIEESGAGAIILAFERLKAKLQAEGLFDATRKRKLSRVPRRIAVISSPSGAAIFDFLTVLARRFPLVEVDLWPSLVQGDQAPAQICAAIADANRLGIFYDALVITRGGGSALDLNCFNDESVVRAIAGSLVFTVSAIGHETDQSLSDFVADLRAATPTAAAEMLTPDRGALTQQILVKRQLLSQLMARLMQPKSQRLDYARRLLEAHSPSQRVAQQTARLQRAAGALLASLERRFESKSATLQQLQRRLQNQHPALSLAPRALSAIKQQRTQLAQSHARLRLLNATQLDKLTTCLNTLRGALLSLNPERTLARGYVMVRRDQRVLSAAKDVQEQDSLTLYFADGSVQTTAHDIQLTPPKTGP
jgi:exodeoxyribonuclease VII large subunit